MAISAAAMGSRRAPCGTAPAALAGTPLVLFRLGLFATFLAFPLATAAVAGAYWAVWTAGTQTYVMTLSVVRHCDSFGGTAFCDSFFAGDTEVSISSLQGASALASSTSMPRTVYAILAAASIILVLLQLVVPPCRGSQCGSFIPFGNDPVGTRSGGVLAGIPLAIAVVGITGLNSFSRAANSWASNYLSQATPGGGGFRLSSGFNCAAAASAFAILGSVLTILAVQRANKQAMALRRNGIHGVAGTVAATDGMGNRKPMGAPVDGPAPYTTLPAAGSNGMAYQAGAAMNPVVMANGMAYQAGAAMNPVVMANGMGMGMGAGMGAAMPYASAPPASAPGALPAAGGYYPAQPPMPMPQPYAGAAAGGYYGQHNAYSDNYTSTAGSAGGLGYAAPGSGSAAVGGPGAAPMAPQGMPMLVPLAAPYPSKTGNEEDPI